MQKTKKISILSLIFVLSQGVVHAEEVKGVQLSDTAKVETKTITKKGESYIQSDVRRVTRGLRQKKVALFWASVYVAQVFTNAKADFSSIDKLRESLLSGVPVVVTMTFLRDVGIDKIVEGYQDVFKANAVNTEEAPFKGFLEAVKASGDVKDKQVFEFSFISDAAAKFEFKFKTGDKAPYVAKLLSKDQLEAFFKMWLGKPVDSGLEQLQEQLLKPSDKI